MDFVANDMKFDHFIIKQWGGRFKVWGSGFGVRGCDAGFAASIYGAMPEGVRDVRFPVLGFPHRLPERE